ELVERTDEVHPDPRGARLRLDPKIISGIKPISILKLDRSRDLLVLPSEKIDPSAALHRRRAEHTDPLIGAGEPEIALELELGGLVLHAHRIFGVKSDVEIEDLLRRIVDARTAASLADEAAQIQLRLHEPARDVEIAAHHQLRRCTFDREGAV